MSESPKRTLLVATVLCGVCSVLVAGAYVALKPKQDFNRDIDFKKNILMSAGLLGQGTDVNETFKQVEPIVVDLETGKMAEGIDPKSFDQSKADKDPQYNENLSQSEDKAGIKRISRLQKVYLVKKDGAIDQIVLHIYGKGLWSTMKGFLSLDKDTTTVRGFNFYSHAETPGLGGEVDNPKWISQWPGKKVFSDNFEAAVDVVKGNVDPNSPGAEHKIDGLSGATLTSVGVENTFTFWLSDKGYAKFLTNVRNGEIQ
ncbi:Na(+)-translocating NADH-quinone reductase subunit C [Peredibacter starrii]|uniref:Na(+)-translocating NADH-quinone reductase subunit C n=1 Tax=Peredibacter starrii TaxID=28202 RepID=A0AAX4HSI7_9BACT|nr:Na(+)-translocating NADH-quinone reductase subunit C [Peredibacter starrii]WPU66155.1 Na(+)-translocating NADH-quinone reductase subunit C [Peredibacter starrii]